MIEKQHHQLRLAMAKDMLLFTNLPIVEIARRLGFSCEGDFRSMFRRMVYTTPRRWRSGHHLYQPHQTKFETGVKTLHVGIPLTRNKTEPHQVGGTLWLCPRHLMPIDSITTLAVTSSLLVGVDGSSYPIRTAGPVLVRPALHRIDCTLRGNYADVQMTVSTRNFTIDVEVTSPRPAISLLLDVNVSYTRPVLPEGAALWTKPYSNIHP